MGYTIYRIPIQYIDICDISNTRYIDIIQYIDMCDISNTRYIDIGTYSIYLILDKSNTR